MKTILFTFAWLLSLATQAQDTKYSSSLELRGSGRLVQETKQLVPFTEIQTKQFPATITVEVGGNESSIDITLDDNLRPFLQIDQQNAILKLSFVEPSGKPFWISKSTIRIIIRTPRLIGFRHGSNSDILVQGLSGERFDLVNEANGNVTLRGKVNAVNIVSAANGDVRADDLITQTANVVSRANATLRINAQTVNTVSTGQGQVINVVKHTR